MRALVIGRGSMGKRRIRDLTSLGVDVGSWDPMSTEAIPMTPLYDAVIVSTPPLTHAKYCETQGKIPRFTEADCEYVGWQHYPSATSRFTDWYALFRRLLDGEVEPSAYTLHVGQHLADWHPGTPLSTYYAAQSASGACREMVPFELCWLTGLFGPVFEARGMRAHTTRIAPIDDVYQVIVRHDSGVLGHILIDAVSRPARRHFTLVSDGWTRSWELEYHESYYLAEMRAFVAAVKGEAIWPYSQAEEAANLEVLRTIERSD